LVNAIAPITTERGGRAFRHTIYYPYLLASRHGRGESLAVAVDTPRYNAKAADDVPYIDVAAVHDQAAGTVALFVVNKHPDEETELTVDLAGFPSARLIEHILIHHPDLKAVNSADAPDVVKPQLQNGSLVEEGRVLCRLKPRSYNLIRLSV